MFPRQLILSITTYVLFKKWLTRGIRIPIARFLLHWYQGQSVCVRWNGTDSAKFSVSNGIRRRCAQPNLVYWLCGQSSVWIRLWLLLAQYICRCIMLRWSQDICSISRRFEKNVGSMWGICLFTSYSFQPCQNSANTCTENSFLLVIPSQFIWWIFVVSQLEPN